MAYKWGATNHLLTGMILQVGLTSTIIATEVAMDAQNSPFLGVMQSYPLNSKISRRSQGSWIWRMLDVGFNSGWIVRNLAWMFHSEVQKLGMKSKVEHMPRLNVACLVDAQGKLSMRHQKQGSAGFVMLFVFFCHLGYRTWGPTLFRKDYRASPLT